jgi:hypothetical protein
MCASAVAMPAATRDRRKRDIWLATSHVTGPAQAPIAVRGYPAAAEVVDAIHAPPLTACRGSPAIPASGEPFKPHTSRFLRLPKNRQELELRVRSRAPGQCAVAPRTSSGPLLAPQPDGCDAHDAPNRMLVVLGALS